MTIVERSINTTNFDFPAFSLLGKRKGNSGKFSQHNPNTKKPKFNFPMMSNLSGLLLQTSVQTTSSNDLKSNDLMQAVRGGDEDRVRELVDKSNINQRLKSTKTTLLHFACFYNHFGIVKLLVEKNIDVNAKDSSGLTPIMTAIDKGFTRIIKYLISNGSDLSIFNNQGYNSFHKAILNGNLEVVKYMANNFNNEAVDLINQQTTDLISKKKELSPLHLAVMEGNYPIVEYLLSLKASACDVNATTASNKYTPLHYAVIKNYTSIVQVLLSNNACVNSVDSKDRTPLDLADYYGNSDSIALLIPYQIKNSSRQPTLKNTSLSSFEDSEVVSWLTDLNLEKFSSNFLSNDIVSLDIVALLSKETLKDIGIDSMGPILVLLKAIEKLKTR